MKEYFDMLGVDANASTSEIKKAYKKRALELHPDKGGNNEGMARLNTAYQFLLDPSKRANAAASFQPDSKSNLTYIVVINSDGRFRPPSFKSSIEDLRSLFFGEHGLSNIHFFDSRYGIQNLHSLWLNEWSLNYYERGGTFRGIPYMMLEFRLPLSELRDLYRRLFTEKTANENDLEQFRHSFDSVWIYDNPDYEGSYYTDSYDQYLYNAKKQESKYAQMNSLLHFGLSELAHEYEIFPRTDPRLSSLSMAYQQTLDRIQLNISKMPKGIVDKANPLVIDVIKHIDQAKDILSIDELTRLDGYLAQLEKEHTTLSSFFKKSPELIYIQFIREPLKNELKKNQKYLSTSTNTLLPTKFDEIDNEENNENYLKLLTYQ